MGKEAMKRGKKSSHIFQLCYSDICNSHNTPMIFSIKTHLHKRMLDFNGDRVKLDEWRPILRALSLDRSLHYIAVRSKNSCSKVLDNIDSESKCRTMVKLPVLYSRFIFKKLIDSLSSCLSNNFHLKCLELDGLLLSEEFLSTLILGLRRSSSLQHLSLHRCPLGDIGCEMICACLRSSPNIISIDMSGCNISEKGAYFIAKTLEFQNLNRYGENWKQSLRYRTPDTEVMPGLRRVTLNHNPNIGDRGVQHFIDVLRDDLWLKALDLQNVSLGYEGGEMILNLLQSNTCLSIIDVRNNHGLDHTLFARIMNKLASNNSNRVSEYHWIKEDTLFLPRKPSFESGNISVHQGNVKSQENSLENKNGGSCTVPAVRLTKSSVLPSSQSLSVHQFQKTHSASDVLLPLSNPSNTKRLFPGQCRTRPGCSTKLPWSKCQRPSKPDFFYGSGDVNTLEQARAKIEEISLKLEEETQKRLEAERQKLSLERKHEQYVQDFKQAMFNQVLMDKSVLEEISNAFADFNGFLAIFAKSGLADQLQLEALKSSESPTFSGDESTPMLSPFISDGLLDVNNEKSSTLVGEDYLKSMFPLAHGSDSPSPTCSHMSLSTSRKSSIYKQMDNVSAAKCKNANSSCPSKLFPTETLDDCLSSNEKCTGQALPDKEIENDFTLSSSENGSFNNNVFDQNTLNAESSTRSWLTLFSSDDC